MKRVYVAGAMQAGPGAHKVLGFLENIRTGIRATVETLMEDCAVFCPFVDFLFWFQLKEGESITEEQIKLQSMAWLEVSDALYVCQGEEYSKGTQAEIKRAGELGIPVFRRLEDLKEHFGRTEGTNETIQSF